MEIKNLSLAKLLWENSHIKKVQPLEKTADKERYDVTLIDINWDLYYSGKFISKYA